MDNIEPQESKFLAFESTSSAVFFFFGEFSQPSDRKKGLANPTKGLFRLKKNRHILTKKT
jgi:hypothetical protein